MQFHRLFTGFVRGHRIHPYAFAAGPPKCSENQFHTPALPRLPFWCSCFCPHFFGAWAPHRSFPACPGPLSCPIFFRAAILRNFGVSNWQNRCTVVLEIFPPPPFVYRLLPKFFRIEQLSPPANAAPLRPARGHSGGHPLSIGLPEEVSLNFSPPIPSSDSLLSCHRPAGVFRDNHCLLNSATLS